MIVKPNGEIQVNDDDELISRDEDSQRSGSTVSAADTEGPSRRRSSTKRRSKKETSMQKFVKCFSLQQSLVTLF